MNKSLFIVVLVLFSITLMTYFPLVSQEFDVVEMQIEDLKKRDIDVDALIKETGNRLKINYEEQPSQTIRFSPMVVDLPDKIDGFQCIQSSDILVGGTKHQFVIRPGEASSRVATSRLVFQKTDGTLDIDNLSEQEVSTIVDQRFEDGASGIGITFHYADSRDLLIATFFSQYFETSRGTKYSPTEFCEIGDARLVCPSEYEKKGNRRYMLVFLKDNTAIEFGYHVYMTNEKWDKMSEAEQKEHKKKMKEGDVTAVAEYVVKRYRELSQELHAPPAFRQWTIPDEVEAKYISSTDKEITLEKKNGETMEVELSKLSKQDQLYVQRRMAIARPCPSNVRKAESDGGEVETGVTR